MKENSTSTNKGNYKSEDLTGKHQPTSAKFEIKLCYIFPSINEFSACITKWKWQEIWQPTLKIFFVISKGF